MSDHDDLTAAYMAGYEAARRKIRVYGVFGECRCVEKTEKIRELRQEIGRLKARLAGKSTSAPLPCGEER